VSSPHRLDQILFTSGAFPSRAKAAAAIEAGRVTLNGVVVHKPGARVPVEGCAIAVAEAVREWVGRGALKLERAITMWRVPVEGRTALDVGASTGGFTEVLLVHGAARVHAVDVGHGQLHPTLAADPRVVVHEGVDARVLDRTRIPEPVGVVVCDASFIGLAKVLPAALALAEPGADLIALVKPQFEVGPQRVGKGGIVRDPAARSEALAAVSAWLEGEGWPVRDTAESPVTGGGGNVEYLLWARRA
jgi:23S rRNA (cytidine1920-2'-O)/16S rRNA (cytidine1409-2'-O)-methyltransferase